MEIVLLIIGVVLGFVLGFAIAKMKNQNSIDIKVLDEKVSSLTAEKEELKSNLDAYNKKEFIMIAELAEAKTNLRNYEDLKMQFNQKSDELMKLNAILAETSANLKVSEENRDKIKLEIEEIQKNFKTQIENFSAKLFEEKSQKFTQQNKENIDIILTPLKDKIKDFEKIVRESYDSENRDRNALKGEISKLFELNQKISQEANRLTNALKGEAKTQGNWGELILENILEQSGLQKDREFFIQKSVENEEGKRFQPDVVVKYPGDKYIIIDSKVSLNAYERYCNADSKEEQSKALDEHIISVRNHIKELSAKSYETLYGVKSLDYVFMFMPIEPAFLVTLQYKNEIWSEAYNKKIVLISPTTLIATLKLIHTLWSQEYQNKNAAEIARQAGDFYDKFVLFSEDLIKIGESIDRTQQIYTASMNKLKDGKGNIFNRIEKLKELGIKNTTTKQINKDFLE